MGLGLGVITGSLIKTITLYQRYELKESTTIKSGPKISISPSKENFRIGIFDNLRPQKNLTHIKGEDRLLSLNSKWKNLASKQNDLESTGFLLLVDTGKYATLNPELILPAASTIKIPILITALMLIDSGELKWNDSIKLNQKAIASGAGWMAYQPIGKIFPVHEIATEMIRVSDNTATNLLIQRIGGLQAVNEYFKSIGLYKTQLNNLLPDLKGSNKTSAKDLAMIIAKVDKGEILSQRSRDLFREVMSTSISNRLIPGGLLKGLGVYEGEPDYNLQIKGYRVYNKTGDIGIVYADAGLIELPNNTRAVAGFIVKGPYNDPRSAELIRDLAAEMVPLFKSEMKKRPQTTKF